MFAVVTDRHAYNNSRKYCFQLDSADTFREIIEKLQIKVMQSKKRENPRSVLVAVREDAHVVFHSLKFQVIVARLLA